MLRTVLFISASLVTTAALAQSDPVSVDEGKRISVIGGCHDCHTVGYSESAGMIDPAAALKGNPVGFRGPWGTTYAVNLRLEAAEKTEDEWVEYTHTFEAKPQCPGTTCTR